MDNEQNVVEGNGYSISKVLAIPLQQQTKTELWIGTTLCLTAMAGARVAPSQILSIVGGDAIPNESNVLPWKADVANAFFFVGNFGGSPTATEYTKFFIREVFNCNAHNKPHNNIHIKMKHVKGKMLQELSEQVNIPHRHMQYLREHYLHSNHSHTTSSLQFDPFPFLNHNRQKYHFIVNDAQCTASVVMAGVLASLKLTNTRLSDNTILLQGAEEAALAIASFCVMAMKKDGLSEADAARKLWVVDNKGLIVKNRPNGGWNASFSSYAHKHDPADTLAEAVEQIKPTILVGAAAIGGAFTPAILKRMAEFNDRPIIFALSNSTSKAECTAEDAYKYTSGKCVFASGSPFPPVVYDRKTYFPGQCNSSHIFPGVALAVICTGASTIPEEVFLISAEKLAGMVTAADLDKGSLYGRFDNCILQIATTNFLYEAGVLIFKLTVIETTKPTATK
ncbi:NADP-dependent malic enzyme-like [Bradysia coprophila]|uniref:NADP-dependent malic enzyme-like n=1 Tax=Bradysia coprophila TaxID=38358 RepID=UPI00187DB322|nr:NADP-dependent malic enzyme-like [Bradysia coprophila]